MAFILVIDDEEASLDALAAIIRSGGHEVITARARENAFPGEAIHGQVAHSVNPRSAGGSGLKCPAQNSVETLYKATRVIQSQTFD
jgi:DNA-binding NtrC family response regulator